MNIEEKKKQRFQFLKKVFDVCHGSQSYMSNMWEIGNALNLDKRITQDITNYLIEEDLLKAGAMGGGIMLAHNGIKEVEEALENPDRATEHFMPFNIIHVQNMNNSVIQQGVSQSSQAVNQSSFDLEKFKGFLIEVKNALPQLNLPEEKSREILAEIATAQAQIDSPKPKKTILKEVLQTMRSLIEGVAGNVISAGLQGQLDTFLSALH